MIPTFRKKEILKLYEVFESKSKIFESRRDEFIKILKIYYKWADKKELISMFDVVYNHELLFQANQYAKKVVEEYKSLIIELFGNIDEDHNGMIDVDEFKKVLPISMFAEADSNKDGMISMDEFIDFLTTNSNIIGEIRSSLNKILNEKKTARDNTLKSIFKSYPEVHETNWRPSLVMLHSPQTRMHKYYMQI